jgi:hypothetical protein
MGRDGIFRPFRAFNLKGCGNPGRCPGLRYGAPWGLNTALDGAALGLDTALDGAALGLDTALDGAALGLDARETHFATRQEKRPLGPFAALGPDARETHFAGPRLISAALLDSSLSRP